MEREKKFQKSAHFLATAPLKQGIKSGTDHSGTIIHYTVFLYCVHKYGGESGAPKIRREFTQHQNKQGAQKIIEEDGTVHILCLSLFIFGAKQKMGSMPSSE